MNKPRVSAEHLSVPTAATVGDGMHTMLQNSERPARIGAYEHCTIARQNGSPDAGVLLNLSDQGFCLQTSLGLEVGERLEMQVPGLGRISGIVRWTDGSRTGGVLEPFTTGAFDNTED